MCAPFICFSFLWRFSRTIYCLSIPFCIRHHQFSFLAYFRRPFEEEEEEKSCVGVEKSWSSKPFIMEIAASLISLCRSLDSSNRLNCFWRFFFGFVNHWLRCEGNAASCEWSDSRCCGFCFDVAWLLPTLTSFNESMQVETFLVKFIHSVMSWKSRCRTNFWWLVDWVRRKSRALLTEKNQSAFDLQSLLEVSKGESFNELAVKDFGLLQFLRKTNPDNTISDIASDWFKTSNPHSFSCIKHKHNRNDSLIALDTCEVNSKQPPWGDSQFSFKSIASCSDLFHELPHTFPNPPLCSPRRAPSRYRKPRKMFKNKSECNKIRSRCVFHK